MPATSPTTVVNQHYLSRVMGLAEVMEVAVCDDIVDIDGMRLLAKGARLTRLQQLTLGCQHLRQPLESLLVADGAADARVIVTHATRLLDTSAALRHIAGAAPGDAASLLEVLAAMRFGQPMRMMLALTERAGPLSLDHSITVSLLAVCMARQLNLGPDGQMTAALAGMLHDIGELYIDPAIFKRGKRLLPHEWAPLADHPRIGQVLIDQLETYPAAVGQAVAQHHERADGSGYPHRLQGGQSSLAGQAVAAAEMLAGVLGKDHPLERAELALTLVPGEYSPSLQAAMTGVLQSQQHASHAPCAMPGCDEGIGTLSRRLACIAQAGRSLARSPQVSAGRRACLLEYTMGRIAMVERAFVSTGLAGFVQHEHGHHRGDICQRFEKDVAPSEIQWRLRDIARDLALQCLASQADQAVFSSLICMLDNDTSTPVHAASAPAAY
jgi:hypothetical protein